MTRKGNVIKVKQFRSNGKRVCLHIGADSTGATGNFAPVLTQEPGQTLRFAAVPFMEPVL